MSKSILSVSDDVKWIGVHDKELATFDIVMETKFGTTYNSYFINADKKVIVETVKEKFNNEFIEKIKTLVDPTAIDYVVLNHTEPDHSGSLKRLLEVAPQVTVVGSRQAINYLNEMVGRPFKFCAMKDGDILDLGNKKLHFISAPNLHWPDSMYSYLEEDQLLFTCDSFGAHFSHPEMFDDLVGDYSEAFNYYFDVILKPFSNFMLKAIEKIELLAIKAICPGHGPILRSTWKEKVNLSAELSREYLSVSQCAECNVLIAYVSAYGYTRKIAETIAKAIKEEVDVNIELVDVEHILLGDLEALITKSSAILVGSPTINQNTLLPIYRMFAVLNPIRDKGKQAAAFGSYGWSGEAVKVIENHLKILKLNVVQDGFAAKFYPDDNKKAEIVNFGREFAKKLVLN